MTTATYPSLITGGDPAAPAHVPDLEAFASGLPGIYNDFLDAPELSDLAVRLIDAYDELGWLAQIQVTFLWKRVGGKSKGEPVLAKTQKLSGISEYLSGSTFLVWLAADNCKELTKFQLEALLYTRLIECAMDAESGTYFVRPPDFVGFTDEVRRYGVWRESLLVAANAFQPQLPLTDAPL